MLADQPENPRIRTKINRWNSRDDETVFAILEQLRANDVSPDACVTLLLSAFETMRLGNSLADEIDLASNMDEQLWLVRRHVDHRRYTVLLYSVGENEVHPPHAHHNLISVQVLLRGQIHLREFQRLRRDESGRLILAPTRDAILGPGEVFVATDWLNNAHWFCAHEGAAVIFNINIRGYAPSTFDANDDKGFGRRYMDPTKFLADGTIAADEFDQEEAERRFQGKRLTEFNWVGPTPSIGGGPSIAI